MRQKSMDTIKSQKLALVYLNVCLDLFKVCNQTIFCQKGKQEG